ncbi:hypothetical protein [Clostridium sp. YIM B02500]|uniref:hypothetical protein n=1 Tax=Clostridium sp. YIM B02500 TaxID=2910681 RepID=UPI001EEDE4BD|nr:hypothetical protein [Clostridium sp. YIM B02500]
MNELFKRKGIIPISRDLINEKPEALLEIFKDILIIKADNDFFKNVITYYAYSKHFNIVEEGQETPEYFPIITKDKDEIKLISWEKR